MLNDAAARGRVAARDTILVGPRGVGKTALLTAYARIAQAQGTVVVDLQAVRGEAGLIESLMQHARRLTAEEVGPWRRARASFERLAGFNIGLAGIGAGVSLRDTSIAPARPDAGSLAGALARLAAEVAKDHSSGGLLITVDELQVAAHPDLALLAATLHRLNVDHSGANVTFAASGLPFTTSVLNAAGVTHPDRLFEVVDVPLTLPPNDARYALVEPARAEHVAWEVAASRGQLVGEGARRGRGHSPGARFARWVGLLTPGSRGVSSGCGQADAWPSPHEGDGPGAHQPVRGGEQHVEVVEVLGDPAVAGLGEGEVTLDDEERVLDLGPHRRLA
jgi:hypothetical protein